VTQYKAVALPYIEKFQCLGSNCSDSCCVGWDVRVDRTTYQKLQHVMQESPEERRRMMASVEVLKTDTQDDVFAHFRLDAGGRCSFLDDDELCHIHKNYGQECLSSTCAFYPRVFSYVRDTMEVVGTLSCPEMARLCLQDTHGFDLVEFDINALPRLHDWPVSRVLLSDQDNAYEQLMPEIRSIFLDVFRNEQFPLLFRMFLQACFAHELDKLYASPGDGPISESITRIVEQTFNTDAVESLYRDFQSQEAEYSLAMTLVYTTLKARYDQGGDSRFQQILAGLFRKHGFQAADEEVQGMIERFHERSSALPQAFHDRLQHYLTRYCMNHLYREWYTGFPTIISYQHMLIVRVLSLEFITIMDSRLDPVLDDEIRSVETLDHIIVDIIYSYAKAIDQNLTYLRAMYEAMDREGLLDFQYSLALTRV